MIMKVPRALRIVGMALVRVLVVVAEMLTGGGSAARRFLDGCAAVFGSAGPFVERHHCRSEHSRHSGAGTTAQSPLASRDR